MDVGTVFLGYPTLPRPQKPPFQALLLKGLVVFSPTLPAPHCSWQAEPLTPTATDFPVRGHQLTVGDAVGLGGLVALDPQSPF